MRAPYAAVAALLAVAGCTSEVDPRPAAPAKEASAEPAVLEWQPVDGPVAATVTRNSDWTLTVAADGRSWELAGPASGSGGGSQGQRVSDALLDEDWAVVVLQDEAERRPSTATVTDLATGETFTLDGRSPVPTTTGGTWALGDDRLVHATVRGGRYCLAEVDLGSRRSSVAWCAPERHGFSTAQVSDDGEVSLLTFDDARPSCRTVVSLDDGTPTPYAGVEECAGWEGVRTDGGAVWSVIPDERRIEDARFHGRSGGAEVDLGAGIAGSLVACGGAAYFARDPQREGQPATLVRWTAAEGASVVYESPPGDAFLEPPRCGGDAITVTARTSAGDEQVSASVGPR
ncbi:hypothetical protein GON03_10635 [Nocardioides sp. MAH-18]|uniref:PQQ-binding-like beta-propeller repeat protein n=1 Tax=Nocardioides agri TaxID=2682843 RepID=A0A6L6XSP1_9ACTN|nr:MULTISPECIES: hypothetical protein [unclassified Nocardioides]MBA2954782.1 hypothetical protein [Nocardioides sp. CGMCC 1.13656]MVQ49637.1 hypothetical protein [Nocardioides sp. MAH-18]